jgi:hypothetical protein
VKVFSRPRIDGLFHLFSGHALLENRCFSLGDNSATDLIVAAICAVATIYLISTVCLKLFKVSYFCRRFFFTVLLSVQHLRGNGRHFERLG